MSIGFSIFLLVVGAILAFAVNVSTAGFNLNAIGGILMVAGALGLLLSSLSPSSLPRSRRRAPPDDGTLLEERRIGRDAW